MDNPPMTVDQEVAFKVEAARLNADTPVLTLSEQTGIPRTSLIRRLQGKSSFEIHQLVSVADALGVSLGSLLPTLPRSA